jgi:hypothetical protein
MEQVYVSHELRTPALTLDGMLALGVLSGSATGSSIVEPPTIRKTGYPVRTLV